ncbi:MAG: hypothetical protein QOG03_2325 [Actinomycetota bacterium]|nr:hypothetical protein [Actinomycetota bacterium]
MGVKDWGPFGWLDRAAEAEVERGAHSRPVEAHSKRLLWALAVMIFMLVGGGMALFIVTGYGYVAPWLLAVFAVCGAIVYGFFRLQRARPKTAAKLRLVVLPLLPLVTLGNLAWQHWRENRPAPTLADGGYVIWAVNGLSSSGKSTVLVMCHADGTRSQAGLRRVDLAPVAAASTTTTSSPRQGSVPSGFGAGADGNVSSDDHAMLLIKVRRGRAESSAPSTPSRCTVP